MMTIEMMEIIGDAMDEIKAWEDWEAFEMDMAENPYSEN